MRTVAALAAALSSLVFAAGAHADSEMLDAGRALVEAPLPSGLTDLPREAPVSGIGFALQLGGGVTSFAESRTREQFGTGGYWELRAVLGTRGVFGGELAYVGSHRRADSMGPGSSAALVGNGAEGTVRAKLPLSAGGLRVEPFVFGGAGWSRYQVVGDGDPRAMITPTTPTDAVSLPVGSGLVMAHENLLLDLRVTYRAAPRDRDLRSWAAGVTVGCEI
jgi:hypothetical protein